MLRSFNKALPGTKHEPGTFLSAGNTAGTKASLCFQGAYIPVGERDNRVRYTTKNMYNTYISGSNKCPKKTGWGKLMENDRQGTGHHLSRDS